jgi:hypothetical protein
MPHRYRVGQTVLPTAYVRELAAVYEVVRLLPEDMTSEPQYRLRSTTRGVEIVSRECEVRPFRAGDGPQA